MLSSNYSRPTSGASLYLSSYSLDFNLIMASLNGVSPANSHSTSPPTATTQPNLSDTNGTSPVKEKSSQDNQSSRSAAAAVPAAFNGHPPPLLNPRSCTTCRKRKVRCDKRHPCANCSKANIDCVFPGPGRAPRRSRKTPDSELLARLRRLEGVVQSLGKGLDEEPGSIEVGSEVVESPHKVRAEEDGNWKPCPSSEDGGIFGLHTAKRDNTQSENMVKEFGRLTVEGGRSRYVSNKFWVSLSEEVRNLEHICDASLALSYFNAIVVARSLLLIAVGGFFFFFYLFEDRVVMLCCDSFCGKGRPDESSSHSLNDAG